MAAPFLQRSHADDRFPLRSLSSAYWGPNKQPVVEGQTRRETHKRNELEALNSEKKKGRSKTNFDQCRPELRSVLLSCIETGLSRRRPSGGHAGIILKVVRGQPKYDAGNTERR